MKLQKEGLRVSNKHFIIAFSPGRTKRNRLGVTVTKRVGKAAIRNRIKRIIREHFRHNRHDVAGNWDINIIAKIGTADLSAEDFRSSLQHVFVRLSEAI
ncbi:MAG: ribonuclease P protein component [Desulfobacterales bacterium]|nr:ribonuclease P protein component [Desulfobacterales bacterium]